MYNGSTIPNNWSICDGNGNYIDDNGNDQQIPDLRDKFIIGAGTFSLNTSGGSSTITIDNLPSHNHGTELTTENAGGHTHSVYANAGGTPAVLGTESNIVGGLDKIDNQSYVQKGNQDIDIVQEVSDHTHKFNTINTGEGVSYYPPYYALYYIIKVSN